MTRIIRCLTGVFVLAAVAAPAAAQDAPDPADRQVYFGEEHMHTHNSFDAVTVGVNQTWEQAYRFAMGEKVTLSTTGDTIQRRTPYDFVAITDHSEYFGVLKDLIDPASPLSTSDFAKGLTADLNDPNSSGSYLAQLISTLLNNSPLEEYVTPELLQSNWQKYVNAANQYYKPGEFTTLFAYEWTSIPGGRNMHRNVFFRDKAPPVPFSAFDSYHPEDLWTYMEVMRNLGIESLAIPHNSNVSDGWMFGPNKLLAGPIDERYARRQQRNEPLFEMAQVKGQSEAHPLLSPNDEFAGFEQFPNLINTPVVSQVKHGFYREALAYGFLLEQELGVNPYKMGAVAGADVHSGYQANEEFNYYGAHGRTDDTPQKRLNQAPNAATQLPGPIVSSAGTTAIWADRNTREALFDGLQRKETYGTSGTLIRLRVFGGWDFAADMADGDDFARLGYAGGVPMGGDLPAMPSGTGAPTLAIQAVKDPESGNLDRIQIIKVWLDARLNRPTEHIYDVALADGRTVGADGSVAPVGNTVDVSTATYTNDIGDAMLTAVWTDPDFDPSRHAAYYVRVLEIPTPRWSTYDAVRNNLPLPTVVPHTIQERAWSSPVWYTPAQ